MFFKVFIIESFEFFHSRFDFSIKQGPEKLHPPQKMPSLQKPPLNLQPYLNYHMPDLDSLNAQSYHDPNFSDSHYQLETNLYKIFHNFLPHKKSHFLRRLYEFIDNSKINQGHLVWGLPDANDYCFNFEIRGNLKTGNIIWDILKAHFQHRESLTCDRKLIREKFRDWFLGKLAEYGFREIKNPDCLSQDEKSFKSPHAFSDDKFEKRYFCHPYFYKNLNSPYEKEISLYLTSKSGLSIPHQAILCQKKFTSPEKYETFVLNSKLAIDSDDVEFINKFDLNFLRSHPYFDKVKVLNLANSEFSENLESSENAEGEINSEARDENSYPLRRPKFGRKLDKNSSGTEFLVKVLPKPKNGSIGLVLELRNQPKITIKNLKPKINKPKKGEKPDLNKKTRKPYVTKRVREARRAMELQQERMLRFESCHV